jgi:hypothetical protein
MSETEQELFKIIRENDNPAQALIAAATVIIGYLKQHESFAAQAPVCQPVFV